MAQLPFGEGLAVLESRTRWSNALILAFMGAGVLTAIGEGLEIAGTVDIEAPVLDTPTMIVGLVYIAFFVLFLVSALLVAMWIYRAHANLFAAGLDNIEFTPGWSIGWFFVPFANLVMPFRAMRELWNASHGHTSFLGGETAPTVRIWWGCFLTGNILSYIGTRTELIAPGAEGQTVGLAIDAVATLITVAAAWFLLKIIRVVMDAQRGHLQASAAFA